MILDFISAKVQSERARSANSKRSDVPFKNLGDGTRLSVPCPRSGTRRLRKARMGGHYALTPKTLARLLMWEMSNETECCG